VIPSGPTAMHSRQALQKLDTPIALVFPDAYLFSVCILSRTYQLLQQFSHSKRRRQLRVGGVDNW
jgi:hypothetical protein